MEEADILGSKHDCKHFCLFYGSNRDLLDLVLPYFREGLRKNMLCAWVVPDSLGIKGAENALNSGINDFLACVGKGQFELFDYKSIYIKSGVFNPADIMDRWGTIAQRAFDRGFDGVWASGDVSWHKEVEWGRMVDYERMTDSELKKSKMRALCTYPLEQIDLVQKFVLVACHEMALIQKDGEMQVVRR